MTELLKKTIALSGKLSLKTGKLLSTVFAVPIAGLSNLSNGNLIDRLYTGAKLSIEPIYNFVSLSLTSKSMSESGKYLLDELMYERFQQLKPLFINNIKENPLESLVTSGGICLGFLLPYFYSEIKSSVDNKTLKNEKNKYLRQALEANSERTRLRKTLEKLTKVAESNNEIYNVLEEAREETKEMVKNIDKTRVRVLNSAVRVENIIDNLRKASKSVTRLYQPIGVVSEKLAEIASRYSEKNFADNSNSSEKDLS